MGCDKEARWASQAPQAQCAGATSVPLLGQSCCLLPSPATLHLQTADLQGKLPARCLAACMLPAVSSEALGRLSWTVVHTDHQDLRWLRKESKLLSLSCRTAGRMGPSRFCSGAIRASCGLTAWLLADTLGCRPRRVELPALWATFPVPDGSPTGRHWRMGGCIAPCEPLEHGSLSTCTAAMIYPRVAALKLAICLHLQGKHCPPLKDLQASALLKVGPAMPAPGLEVHQSPELRPH